VKRPERTKVLHVRMTPEAHRLAAERARAAGKSLSEWTRLVLSQTIGVDKPRFHTPGEVGFAGLFTFHCPKHGFIMCACKKETP
jgi:hypothetical protein